MLTLRCFCVFLSDFCYISMYMRDLACLLLVDLFVLDSTGGCGIYAIYDLLYLQPCVSRQQTVANAGFPNNAAYYTAGEAIIASVVSFLSFGPILSVLIFIYFVFSLWFLFSFFLGFLFAFS